MALSRSGIYVGLLLLCAFLSAHIFAQPASQPKANDKAIVQAGNARFTILTPDLIRLEWAAGAAFSDNASQVFINRKLPVPAFTTDSTADILTLKTSELTLIYHIGKDSFNRANLRIFSNHNFFSWQPCDKDSLNLKGTMRTLDGMNGGSLSQLEDGIISRGGWALINDSKSYLFDGDMAWNWIKERADTTAQDWYFFGYGHHYKEALRDFTRVAGTIPMPPRYAFGYWWSRYWIYSAEEMKELAQTFRAFNIPIDVMIVDMDWHETYGLRGNACVPDGQGSIVGWTGYTWNRNLFPKPKKFLDWMEEHHIKNALNLHPSSGIPPMEARYDAFAKAWHFDTSGRPYIPYRGSDKSWAQIYFDSVLHPLEKQGIDFWWLDWQQFPQDPLRARLSNTWWLNYLFCTDMEREGKRPLLFHRWGGLGNHRYQIGFSGDSYISWKSLAFQPGFTATAANVGYGYWSHDIGGHQYSDSTLAAAKDKELFLRWMQFGVFSPILRTHSGKRAEIDRRIWTYGTEFLPLKNLIQLRYEIAPYLYTAAWNAYQSGVSVCHPLYFEWSGKPQAYDHPQEYYFGNDLIVAPVTQAVDTSKDFLATQKIWLPEGEWEEWMTGVTLKGGSHERRFSRYEIPVYIRSGSIIPLYAATIQNLQERHDSVTLLVVKGEGSGALYEDDGITNGYQKGRHAITDFTQHTKRSNAAEEVTISINPAHGSYDGAGDFKTYSIQLIHQLLPLRVMVNGVILGRNDTASTQGYFTYEASAMSTIVHLHSSSVKEKMVVQITLPAPGEPLPQGILKFANRIRQATEMLKYQISKVDWGATLPNELLYAESYTSLVNDDPGHVDFAKLTKIKAGLRKVILSVKDVPRTELIKICDFLELE